MIFTRTKKEADSVSSLLGKEEGLNVTVMHSDIKQKDRMAALKGFK
ncbi:MAG: ATP-dependent helicase, partial [Okeania sp. SIO2H7]|nr:ATP-dependent helicase [Okeania sp. SIO2H7]